MRENELLELPRGGLRWRGWGGPGNRGEMEEAYISDPYPGDRCVWRGTSHPTTVRTRLARISTNSRLEIMQSVFGIPLLHRERQDFAPATLGWGDLAGFLLRWGK